MLVLAEILWQTRFSKPERPNRQTVLLLLISNLGSLTLLALFYFSQNAVGEIQ